MIWELGIEGEEKRAIGGRVQDFIFIDEIL